MYTPYNFQEGYRNYQQEQHDERFPFLPFLAGLAVSPFVFGGGGFYGRPPYPYYGRPPYWYGYPPFYGGYGPFNPYFR